jgi:hypothetical protein
MTISPSVLVYGRTKIGKTTDVLYALRNMSPFVIVTEPHALDPVEANFGFRPASVELITPQNPQVELMRVLNGPATAAVAAGAKALVWDSLTAFGTRLFSDLMVRHRDGRRVYSLMRPAVADLVSTFLAIPAPIHIAIAHEEPPHEGEYGLVRGGPKLQDRQLTEAIPGLFRLVLRATTNGQARFYECNGMDAAWIMGDGYGCAAMKQPMDLRPLLWRAVNGDRPLPDSVTAPKPYRTVAAHTVE